MNRDRLADIITKAIVFGGILFSVYLVIRWLFR